MTTHNTHTNSHESWQSLRPANRIERIIAAFRMYHDLTDRECMESLGLTDMNSVRPRITEMIEQGVLHEGESRTDHVTKKTVRTCSLAPAMAVVTYWTDGKRPELDPMQYCIDNAGIGRNHHLAR